MRYGRLNDGFFFAGGAEALHRSRYPRGWRHVAGAALSSPYER
jgi:hypothetical protein